MDRRHLLKQIGGGFGAVALQHLIHNDALGDSSVGSGGGLHHRPKVRRVIQLFMTGGASPMDTFDYKPNMYGMDGKIIPIN